MHQCCNNQTEGLFELDATIQFNKLNQLSYKYTPIQKTTTIQKKRLFTPFVSGSLNSLGMAGAGGGIYYHNLGFELKYVVDIYLNKGFEIGLHYKF